MNHFRAITASTSMLSDQTLFYLLLNSTFLSWYFYNWLWTLPNTQLDKSTWTFSIAWVKLQSFNIAYFWQDVIIVVCCRLLLLGGNFANFMKSFETAHFYIFSFLFNQLFDEKMSVQRTFCQSGLKDWERNN